MKSLAVLLTAAALLGAGCSSDSADDGSADPLTIKVQDNSYAPATKTINAGQTLTWTWTGSASHSVTFSDTDTSPTQSSGTYTHLFVSPGTYTYHCKVHGTAMSGTITVVSGTGGSGIIY